MRDKRPLLSLGMVLWITMPFVPPALRSGSLSNLRAKESRQKEVLKISSTMKE
ncbi:hypothetical protein P170DRAFT_152987 [Aspergillus steynii IBT 23096]|uniref:Uncharacterized protein n=1 Tax=Aspergillus steynii IBT 23096 TaxID=1392250 RepID=A0A2I2GD00_9EURO|nr:uncharacterized protein P170DRAFT_152987 [Aspergillus steynii IBT 23096]PLB50745.1 hypothetical protein P170DRAFT_152987 [Aspergillus steynii IBT 23096]